MAATYAMTYSEMTSQGRHDRNKKVKTQTTPFWSLYNILSSDIFVTDHFS